MSRSAPTSPARIPESIALPARYGGAGPAPGGGNQGDEHQRPPPPVRAQQPQEPSQLAPALVLPPDKPPQLTGDQKDPPSHRRATSSRSSRSRWRNTVSSS